MAISRKIPISENGPGVHCTTQSGDEYIISQCLVPRRFTLWQKVTGGWEKKAISSISPKELYDKIPWNEGTPKKASKK